MIGIYKITNKINGKYYIGQSKNIEKRMIYHKWDSKKKDKKEWPLYRDINKYGIDNFTVEVLEECSEEELNDKEFYYINKYDATNPNKGYNFCANPISFKDKRMREIRSKHARKAIKEFNKKAWKDEEYRKKMSEQSRKLQIERLKDPEYLAEKTEQLKKATDKMKLRVGKFDKDGNLLEVYPGLRIAERANNLPNDSVGKVCRGVKYRKTAGGFVWKFLPEEEV